METMVKHNVKNGVDSTPAKRQPSKCAQRGKRYSPAIKQEILHYARQHSVAQAAIEFGVTETTIYEWRRAAKRRGNDGAQLAGPPDQEPQQVRDSKILAMWRQHPGYGPSQIRNMLKRSGFKVSVGTVRHVMEQNGYLPPTLRKKEHVGRYEAGRPRELYHLDFYHFYVHKQKQCVLFVEDDFSRFIAGWAMVGSENADAVIQCFTQAVERYGKPEGLMSDRGSAFHSWKGLSRFEAVLQDYEVNYYLAKTAAVNGKVEALNANFQKECVEQTEFMDLTDAARVIGRWVDHYNHQRTHHGLGGLLVPADRFYGIAEQSLRRIEQGLGAPSAELTHPDSRGLELFRVVSHAGNAQLWLMGQKILG
jgi:transposase InsO family protein